MRMDQITARDIEHAAQDFIDSIDPELICALASSYHGDQPCRIFSAMKKGSFNLCYPVVFTSDPESADGEKWIVRIPWMPRIAFPEEKMRGEIATMKYIAERTTIPIPRLLGYSVGSNNLVGVPFMLLEYIDGRPLSENDVSSDDLRTTHVYRQLANIFFELYAQQFDGIGALTLDSNDSHWVFGNARPLSSNINEQDVAGLNASAIFPPQHIFKSTVDYVYALTRLTLNEYVEARDSVLDEDNGRDELYDLHKFREILMDWIMPEYNHGPFFLMHGDLRPPNIIVDEDYNIKAIIDWEWSRTVPAQLFVPPGWLSGSTISTACHGIQRLGLKAGLVQFITTVEHQIRDTGRYPQGCPWDHPLIVLWKNTLSIRKDIQNFCIAHALLRVDIYIDIYWKILDYYYHGRDDRKKRVEMFFRADARKPQADLLHRKLDELEIYKKDLNHLGIELQPREDVPAYNKLDQALISKECGQSWDKKEQVSYLQPLADTLRRFAMQHKDSENTKHLFWATVSAILIATPSFLAVRRFWQ